MRTAAFTTTAICAALLLLGAAPARADDARTYAPGPFDRIEIDGHARVTLTQGATDQVVVHGDDATQRRVEVSLDGTRLSVHTSENWKFWRNDALHVDVQMREPRAISLSGASDLIAQGPLHAQSLTIDISGTANVRMDAIDADALRFDVSGAGDGRLAGRAGALAISLSGTGKIKAEDLRTSSAKVSISGAGGARLWVTDALDVDISGIGSVDYWGHPARLRRDTSGLGSIKALGDKH
ncbi:MAG: DUF2807 domain-containing protein [Pelomonas sp.]|nr:DUF2807 domain-containing protein [Roseateles sp.]